ncbi:hypothetical protein [Actinomadura macrotermitis]|uniref:hypothetical protein n=1 Tax=Actinomadura macrotermitis TaxID=2585200 RepID=UPI001294CECC|nr:hypothetical protein [Actinomadura macrotermitis]
MPLGPERPEGAPAADLAVLAAAFRGALERARAASPAGREQMLGDALAYRDEALLRAVLSAALEAGQDALLDVWAAREGRTALLTEVRALLLRTGIDPRTLAGAA